MTYIVEVALKKNLVVKAASFADMVERVKRHCDARKVLDVSDPQDQKFDDEYEAYADIWHAKEIV